MTISYTPLNQPNTPKKGVMVTPMDSPTLSKPLVCSSYSMILQQPILSSMKMEIYYEQYKDFCHIHVSNDSMPSIVKRLLSHGKHTFFSPSERLFYLYNPKWEEFLFFRPYKKGPSLIFQLRTKDKKSDCIYISDRFLELTQSMNP